MYTVYKTVNLVNGKFYIGVHKTDNPNDDYLGSGKLIKRAIKKYGIENFHKEVIASFESRDDAYALEMELVVLESQCYNLKKGGEGGFDYINANGLISTLHRPTNLTLADQKLGAANLHARWKTDPKFRKYLSEIRRTAAYNINGFIGYMSGKSHTETTKHKMAIKASLRTGDKNSQFGTCWIKHESYTSKKIKLTDLDSWISLGWIRGR